MLDPAGFGVLVLERGKEVGSGVCVVSCLLPPRAAITLLAAATAWLTVRHGTSID